jgi:hypothetical protein
VGGFGSLIVIVAPYIAAQAECSVAPVMHSSPDGARQSIPKESWCAVRLVIVVASVPWPGGPPTTIQEHGQSFIGYIATCEPGLDEDLISGFKDAYCGEWDSENAYAEDLIREVGLAGVEQFPDSLMPYLDIDKVARELFLHGTLCTHPAPAGGVFVFDTAA